LARHALLREMEPLRTFCEKYGSAPQGGAAPASAGDDDAPLAMPVEGLPVEGVDSNTIGADALAAAAASDTAAASSVVKSEDGRPPLIARSESAIAGAAASAATLPGPKADVLVHRLGTGGAPGSGLSGEALMEEFRKVLKGALSWRPETAQIIYDATGWRKRSDGKVVAPAEWHSVCPSDLRTLAQKLEGHSWFRGHSDDDYVTPTLRENAIFRLYAAMRRCVCVCAQKPSRDACVRTAERAFRCRRCGCDCSCGCCRRVLLLRWHPLLPPPPLPPPPPPLPSPLPPCCHFKLHVARRKYVRSLTVLSAPDAGSRNTRSSRGSRSR
jgi:hypothetical protein